MGRAGIARAFHVYRRAFREARGFWPALALILAVGLAWTPMSLLMPLPLKLVVDGVLGGKPLSGVAAKLVPPALAGHPARLLAAAIGLSLALGLLGVVYKFGEWLLRETVADRLVHRFRGRMLLHGLMLPALHHARNGTLDLGYRINQDAPALQWTAMYGVIPLIVAGVNIACTVYVTAAISASLAAVALATALPGMALVHLCQRRLKTKWHAAKEQESAMQAQVHEVLGALRIVTVFGQERRETERYLARSRLSMRARLKALSTEGLLGALLSLSTALGTAAILYLGARDAEAGVLSVGDLLLIVTYVGQLYGPLQAIGTHVSGQQHAVASMERAFAVLDQENALADRPGARALGRARGDITFRDVFFAYGEEPAVLRQASFHVPAGSVVGITGRTGAGKSTLLNLLLRLFDPIGGAILLDGVDLRDWRLADLRRQFAVLPQDAALFATTIAENIGYGRPAAGRAEIIAAARAANIHEFISALPAGYDTAVGERGLRLSGGERQRLALARALLADAPVIILDEPTSAIDQQTEAAIVESLERLRQGRTVFIVAHRLATLQHATHRLTVEDGRVTLADGAPPLRKVS